MTDLATLARERGVRRSRIVLRPVRRSGIVRQELSALGRGVVKAWRDGIKSELIPLLEARQTTDGRRIIADDLASDIGAIIDRIAGYAVVADLDLRIRRVVLRTEAIHRDAVTGALKAGLGLDVSALIGSLQAADEVAARQAEMVALIRDVSDQLRKETAGIVFRAVADRQPVRETAKVLRERLRIGRRRALTVARDQQAKVHATLDELRFRDAGLETYAWQASGKANPREEHRRRDGRVYRWDDPPSDGHPGVAINCGCTARAVIELD